MEPGRSSVVRTCRVAPLSSQTLFSLNAQTYLWSEGRLKNVSRKNRDWPPLLEGDVDWPKVMKALRDVGYTGPVVQEVGGGWEQDKKTAEVMRKIIQM